MDDDVAGAFTPVVTERYTIPGLLIRSLRRTVLSGLSARTSKAVARIVRGEKTGAERTKSRPSGKD
jgi:hypothetical protein